MELTNTAICFIRFSLSHCSDNIQLMLPFFSTEHCGVFIYLFIHFAGLKSEEISVYNYIYSTPPLRQDMTQGQFLSGV